MLNTLPPHIQSIFIVLTPFLIGIPLLYPVYRWSAKGYLRFNAYDFFLTTGATYAGFVLLEASFGLIFEKFFGIRLWAYRILPNHHSYGSYLGALMWPLYGVHVYWFKQVMDARAKRFYHFPLVKGAFTAVEGPLFEFVGNGIILLIFSRYLFYYFPSDLWHLTTVQVMPLYALAGWVFGHFFNAVQSAPRTWGLPISLYVMGGCVTMLG